MLYVGSLYLVSHIISNMNSVSEDLRSGVEEFIFAAPSQKIFLVLCRLREVIEDDDAFFELVYPVCLSFYLERSAMQPLRREHWLQCIEGLSLPSPPPAVDRREKMTTFFPFSQEKIPFLASRENHLATWLHRAGSSEGSEPNLCVWEEETEAERRLADVTSYLSGLPCVELASDTAGGGEDNFLNEFILPIGGVENINHIFFDLCLRLYVEVDPVECICLRAFPFSCSSDTPEVLLALENHSEGQERAVKELRETLDGLLTHWIDQQYRLAAQPNAERKKQRSLLPVAPPSEEASVSSAERFEGRFHLVPLMEESADTSEHGSCLELFLSMGWENHNKEYSVRWTTRASIAISIPNHEPSTDVVPGVSITGSTRVELCSGGGSPSSPTGYALSDVRISNRYFPLTECGAAEGSMTRNVFHHLEQHWYELGAQTAGGALLPPRE